MDLRASPGLVAIESLSRMSKAFKKKSDDHAQFARVKNYITPNHTERLAATQRRAPVSTNQGAAGRDTGGRPRAGQAATRVFFGATVRYANAAGTDRVVSVVGVDA